MKRFLPILLLLCGAMPALAQKQPVKTIDTTTLTNGKTIVVYSNKTWKYIDKPATVQIPLFGAIETSNTLSQQKTTVVVPTTKRETSSYSQSSYSSSGSSHQCHATTKKGTQCKRMVVNGYNCWQHGG